MNILDFYAKKKNGEKISVITCYDYTSARILAQTAVDCLLVGDSVAMTMHGFKDTLSATLEMMCFHTAAVARGAGKKFIISDLPFLSYRKSISKNVSAAQVLMQAGACAVKLERAAGNEKLIRHFSESGIPVVGHIGLTPQFIHALGGYKPQGITADSAQQLQEDALRLQQAGCFAIVLECIPIKLAKKITSSLIIPTIGIGAGPFTDGQVLVFQDLLGLNVDFQPKFVKTFLDGQKKIQDSVETYIQEIQSGAFPQHEHCYHD
ncbi:MAG TPA: 3-methyl-2-oxobutanoate hydroxymethyltransferase [Gammaproteobacteria bacterium]|nr:3-methyl-2-oxobutanoate hydroxymethyltransferase [Gammaproteobacteria bacterium]